MLTVASEFDPIFVHASVRSGSTYIFNVLRRNKRLMCFNETILDRKEDIPQWFRGALKQGDPHFQENRKWDINHHFLDRSDSFEFIQAWDSVMHLCPRFPLFLDYLPPNGVLSAELGPYLSGLMKYARSQDKRPVFCEIGSRGRAGALRGAFGGFHIAQYRDPLNQFGSFIRAVLEARFWWFLTFPLFELGTSRAHPLYRLVPEPWRVPVLPWQAKNYAQHWASEVQYLATVASPRPEIVETVFRWHLFSWVLTNLAAISYSDLALDIDKIHDNADYRALISDTLGPKIGAAPDFTDVRKFARYCEFETFDVTAVCRQVESAIRSSLGDGRLQAALGTLSTQPPITATAVAVELLLAKLRDSITSMQNSANRSQIGAEEWKIIVKKNRKIWFNPSVRRLAQSVYPVAAPIVKATRRARHWCRTRGNRRASFATADL
jgi:hypothetical protein